MKFLKPMLARLTAAALALSLLTGCSPKQPDPDITATTLPVWQFTSLLCEGTPLRVDRLITEEVSCLHDYTLTVDQMKAIEGSRLVVISGAGLEEFLQESLTGAETVVDSSEGIELLEGGCHHDHETEEAAEPEHRHETDSHIWLSPDNAAIMAENICDALCREYPDRAPVFLENLKALTARLAELESYGETQLSSLSCREILTFHDGFGYLAHEYDIEILEAIEEEAGAESSAKELIHLIALVEERGLPAIFVEKSGSGSAAGIIAAETGASLYTLDMAMSGDDYFSAMYHNIDTLKEALG